MDSAALQHLLDSAIEEYAVPEAQLGLLRGKERTVVCAGSVAVDSADPVVARTAFRAGSLAKSLTGLLVLDAASRGELSLDVPCSGQADGLWDQTPRALLSQTSGKPKVPPQPPRPGHNRGVSCPRSPRLRRKRPRPMTISPGE